MVKIIKPCCLAGCCCCWCFWAPQDCEAHLQEEERVLLPGLQEELSHQQLMQLGRLFEWAKLVAPSRWVTD